MKKRLLFLTLLLTVVVGGDLLAKGKEKTEYLPYKDSTLDVEIRVQDLIKRMTLEEKMWQLNMNNLTYLRVDKKGKVSQGSLDSLFHGYSLGILESPFVEHELIAKYGEAADHYFRTQTRLGIPAIQMAECIHGQMALGTTIFPQSIAQGSTWNPELITQMAEVIAYEASVSGVDQAFSPLFDLARDPRYGRVEECFGEDPFLVKQMGVSFVVGMQGDPQQTKNGLAHGKVACTAKHFAAYSIPDAGINLAPANVGERTLRDLHFYPFEAAVKQANIYSVMPGYHEIDGVPVHADPWLLRDVLRKEWGFNGYVCSDAMAISMLEFFHHVAATGDDAAMMAIKSGVDVEVSTPITYYRLAGLVKEGKLDPAYVDEAVERVLRVKFRMGLFDRPFVNQYEKAKRKVKVHNDKAICLAQKVAEESIVLMQNNNKILPLKKEGLMSLAVIGPNADNVQFGDYSITKNNDYGISVYEGLQSYLGDDVKLNLAEGCSIMSQSKDGFQAAIDAAKSSDAVVLVMGGTSIIYSGIGWGDQNSRQPNTAGEGFDRHEISIPGVQPELISEISKLGKPIVLVLVNGRPYTLEDQVSQVDAIVEAWYPGEQGGHAIANVLFGEVNPSGKLPISFPRSTGHLPNASIYKPSSRGFYKQPGAPNRPGRDYVFSSPTPLFCFGHGLSYTEFKYEDIKIGDVNTDQDSIKISCKLSNVGEVSGAEVVQLYVRDLVSSVSTPVSALKAFSKVYLESGESKIVDLTIAKTDLMLWNFEMKRVLESGEFEVYVGSSQEDVRMTKKFTIN